MVKVSRNAAELSFWNPNISETGAQCYQFLSKWRFSRSLVPRKSVTVDDFRGISISPTISKVFEHCILDRYADSLITSDNQFGFKKNSSCLHAIYSMRCVVDYYVKFGSTVNLCALDISKTFDKMNHYGLFIKLMQKLVPINLLRVLETWFAIGSTCLKWCNFFSRSFVLSC